MAILECLQVIGICLQVIEKIIPQTMRDRDPLTAFLQWRNPVEIGIDRTHEALHRRAFDTTHESRFV